MKLKECLGIYKETCVNDGITLPLACLVFNSVDSFFEEPTEDIYLTVAEVCINAYLEEDTNLGISAIADAIGFGVVQERKITLNDVRRAPTRLIIDMAETYDWDDFLDKLKKIKKGVLLYN